MVVTTEPVMPHAPSTDDHQPVDQSLRQIISADDWTRVHDSLMKVKRVIDDKEVDMCLLKNMKKDSKTSIWTCEGLSETCN